MPKNWKFILCATIFALCLLLCLFFYGEFTKQQDESAFLLWDKSELVAADGTRTLVPEETDFFSGDLYVLTSTLPSGVSNPVLAFSVANAELRLLLDGEVLYACESGSLLYAETDLPADYAGRTLEMFYRFAGGDQKFLPFLRISNWVTEEASAYAYANLTGITSGLYALAFLLLTGLALLQLYLVKTELRVMPLAFAFLILTVHGISASQGYYFLPEWIIEIVLWEPLQYLPVVLMLLYILLNRRHRCWRIIGVTLGCIAVVLMVEQLIAALSGRVGILGSAWGTIVNGEWDRVLDWVQLIMVYLCTAAALMIAVADMIGLESQRRALSVRVAATQQSLDSMRESSGRVATMRHEIKNRIAVLHVLYRQGKMEELGEALHKLDRESELLPEAMYSDQPIVNAVLQSHAVRAGKAGIRFESFAPLPEELHVEGFDLYCLLSNMLDNALEACERVAAEKRFVCFRAELKGGFLAISCINSCPAGLPPPEELKTTKPDAENHGFGLPQMNEIAAKYGSILDIAITEETFSLKTALHVKAPNEKKTKRS